MDISDRQLDPSQLDQNVRDPLQRYRLKQKERTTKERAIRRKYPLAFLTSHTLDAIDRRESQVARSHRELGGKRRNPPDRNGKITQCNACGSEDHWFATCPHSDKRELMRKNRRAL
jgi:hypothetical protein